ncbi:MAG TPA: beta-ketoacyl synthase N-terminal-like domain-containing protein [Planctomycetota bacterium]|nr:beta-ketoacyl synthase N-terminal-like domain-containing protein [Planctomycetota bacterium]
MPPAAEVVVTGIGMVTPLGATAAESAAAWVAGTSARRAPVAELAGTSLAHLQAAVRAPLDAAARLGSRKMLKFMSESAVLGCVAAHEAAEAAGVRGRFNPGRVGLYSGIGMAGASLEDALPVITASLGASGRVESRIMGERGLAAANPLMSFKILPNMPACLVSIIEGLRGPNLIFTPWEGQAGAALLEGWKAVASGEVDCAVCGAADNPAHPAILVHLARSGRLPPGESVAAAAAYLVLERADTAGRDNRKVWAQLTSVGLEACDDEPADPLAGRMGRSFAAAPAVLLALACCLSVGAPPVSVVGVDRQRFSAEVRSRS